MLLKSKQRMNESEVIREFFTRKFVKLENHVPVPYVFMIAGGNSGKTIFSYNFTLKP